jgi:RNA polymerase sigma-70 factor (ECF subfamily)
VLRQRDAAEDVAQEAFARAFERFGQLRDRDRFRAWLVRMTWRLAIDRWRADRRRAAREEAAFEEPVASVEDVAVARERAARLWEAMDRLPERLRIVTVLAAIEGHGMREVAALLELPEGTVKSRLFEARKALAESLRCLANGSPRS